MTPEPQPWLVARDPGDEDPSCRVEDAFFALVEQLRDPADRDDRDGD